MEHKDDDKELTKEEEQNFGGDMSSIMIAPWDQNQLKQPFTDFLDDDDSEALSKQL